MKPLYFLHIIKTGGTTLINKFKEENSALIKWGHDILYKHADITKVNVFTIIRNPADWQVSIYHQAKRRENFKAGFEEFYEWRRNNKVNPEFGRYNRLCNYAKRFWQCEPHEVINHLDDLWGVTVTDKLNQDLPLLFGYYGLSLAWRNCRVAGEWDTYDNAITPIDYVLTTETREKIYNENPLDVELYMRAKELRKEWTQRLQ